jgi:hypothetical protein
MSPKICVGGLRVVAAHEHGVVGSRELSGIERSARADTKAVATTAPAGASSALVEAVTVEAGAKCQNLRLAI